MAAMRSTGLWLGKPVCVSNKKKLGATFLDSVLLNFQTMVGSPFTSLHLVDSCLLWITPVDPFPRISRFVVENSLNYMLTDSPNRSSSLSSTEDVFCALAASPGVANFVVASITLHLGRL